MGEFAVVDDMIGNQALAINLIARPSGQTEATLGAIQDFVSSCVPIDSVFRCPPHSLHLSVFQFVNSRTRDSSLQLPVWNKYSKKINAQLQSITMESEVCTLETPTIHVGESAVIIKFSPVQGIELLRDRLEAGVKQLELAWNRPTIQHVTICRYILPFRLNQLNSKVSEIDLPEMTWKIGSLDLVREKIYPSLDNVLLQRYALGRSD